MASNYREKGKKIKQRHRSPKSAPKRTATSKRSKHRWLRRFWQAIVGLGILVGLAVGIRTLYFSKYGPTTETVVFEHPTFSENAQVLEVWLGSMGSGYKRSELEKGPREPLNLGDFKPVKMYIEDGNLYADVTIYAGSGLPPIRIERNVVYGKPVNWDINYSSTALEIVDKEHNPIYQFIYKSPSKIVINGIFPFPGGILLATEQGNVVNPIRTTMFRLQRIFKYPGWKYRGKYQEE